MICVEDVKEVCKSARNNAVETERQILCDKRIAAIIRAIENIPKIEDRIRISARLGETSEEESINLRNNDKNEAKFYLEFLKSHFEMLGFKTNIRSLVIPNLQEVIRLTIDWND